MIYLTKWWRIGFFAAMVLAASLRAQVGEESSSEMLLAGKNQSNLEIRPFGMGAFEFGQIVHGQYRKAQAPHVAKLYRYWMEKCRLRIGLEAKQDNGLDIILAGEGALHFPYALPGDSSTRGNESYLPRFDWYIHYALAQYTLGKNENPPLRMGIGFFPFKYNPDAHTFGEYLFRTSSYPQYFPTSFDTPYQRLLGLHLSGSIGKRFSHDLLLTSEVYLWPLKDFSLTYLCNVNLFDVVNIGGGIMGNRLISVENSLTTPPETGNPDHFTARSIKSTVKLSISPEELISSDFFEPKDLRLYSEFCINGWENYAIADSLQPRYPGYDDISKRMLVLYGLNWPTNPLVSYTVIPGMLAFFYNNNRVTGPVLLTEGVGILAGVGAWFLERIVDVRFRPDILSIEAEWWDNSFANSYFIPSGNIARPLEPVSYSESGHMQKYGGAWHWSIFTQKTILDRLTFKAQVGRDHTTIEPFNAVSSTGDLQEVMDGKGNWGWMFKVEYGF